MKAVGVDITNEGHRLAVTMAPDVEGGVFLARENRHGAYVASQTMTLEVPLGLFSLPPKEFSEEGVLSGKESLDQYLTPDPSNLGTYILQRLNTAKFEEQERPSESGNGSRLLPPTFVPEIGDSTNYDGVEIRELHPPARS